MQLLKRNSWPVSIIVLLALVLLSGCRVGGPEESEDFLPAVVTKCVDGDTVHVRLDGRTEKVRFIGINTPELHHPEKGVEPFGREAAAYSRMRLLGKRVYLEMDVQERDKYGRLLAYVWLAPPTSRTKAEVRQKMFNAELLLNGYAQVMTVPPNVRYADMFLQFQREARTGGKGLWGQKEKPPVKGSSRQKVLSLACLWPASQCVKHSCAISPRSWQFLAGFCGCRSPGRSGAPALSSHAPSGF